MPFAPMLASAHNGGPIMGTWAVEPKLDGCRTIVAVGRKSARVWTRNGHELTGQLPEFGAIVDVCAGARIVLDGALVAEPGGASALYSVSPRVAAKRRRAPLTFAAFDVLVFNRSVIDEPYRRRRELLEGLALNGKAWCTVPRLYGSIGDVLAVCAEHRLDGVVAKRVDSRYRPGERSPDWRKLKTADWWRVHAGQRIAGRRPESM
jgi:bifunctional non-homologous end joining protein LigD